MEQSIFYQLSLVMVITAVVSLIMRFFRQPLIIGYIISGFLVGPTLLGIVHDHEAFESFSQIGISLLLFIIGLGLNFGVIKDTGKPVFVAFLVKALGVGGLGYFASSMLGFGGQEALIVAVALLFSSTIVVVKALTDKKEHSRLYGQIAIGILLVEDIAATLALLFVSSSGGGTSSSDDVILLVAKGVLLASGLVIIGGYIMPKMSRMFASSQELLYVFALAWAFGVASVFSWSGFSLEVGALFAGVALAHLPYVQAIASRLKPLRDFFIVLFFIQLGEELGMVSLSDSLIPALIFSAIIIIVKPLLIMGSLGFLGYTKQTSFKTAVHLAQISEFSIVLIVLAVSNGLVDRELTTIVALTALITIGISSYLIKYDDRLFAYFSTWLSVFERSSTKKELRELGHYPLMLLGYSEGGNSYVKTFRQMKKRYIVIDYDPDIVESLERQHINHLYGDVTDIGLLEEIGIHRSELIISTIGVAATNHMLATHITKANKDAIFICRAATFEEAESLYKAGAAYVLMPHYIGDEHINQFLKRNGSSKKAFAAYRSKHLTTLGGIAIKL